MCKIIQNPKNKKTEADEVLKIKFLLRLLSENKLIICALGNLYCQISREKFEPEPGFDV